MSEEGNERYVLEIGAERVYVLDTGTNGRTTFTGPGRLLAATAELNRLNEREELGAPDIELTGIFSSEIDHQGGGTWKPFTPYTPVEFLAKTLPAVARRQRLESHLAEVQQIRESLAAIVLEDTANLNRALALEKKLMAELNDAASPLSATETAQNAPEVVADTPLIRNGYGYPTEVRAWMKQDLFKPGPY